MPDQSNLDKKYFIDKAVYNCPFCNRRNVRYLLLDRKLFDWSEDKECFVYFVRRTSCRKTSNFFIRRLFGLRIQLAEQAQCIYRSTIRIVVQVTSKS